MLNTVRKDLVYAFRMIARTPIVAGVAILSLAIGVSANTTVFAVLHSWLLRPLPYADADRIIMVWENYRFDSDETQGVAPANYFSWREESTSVNEWMAQDFETMNLTGVDRPEQLTATLVTPNFFSVLRATPLLGRTFSPDEGGAGSPNVVVMGETLWRNRFGAEDSVLAPRGECESV